MAEKTVLISQQLLKPIKVLKWKVTEGNSMSIGRVILLYDFDGATKLEHRRLKSTQAGTVHKVIAPEGAIVKPGELLLELKACIHPTVMKDMCAECGADLRKDDTTTTASVPMVHAIPDLKVSEELAQKLGKADGERLLRDRKLVLLVDLDQTLIHTTNDNIPPNIKDVYHFQLYGPNSPWYHTRLRPGTHTFLSNISPYFELHICTFGARNYAHTITMFLDRDESFFSNRILSRDECFDPTSKKANLKALFPCGDNMVCIIDDREDVWNHASNLIHVKPYHFFQHTGDINAPPGLDKHENDDKEGVDLTQVKKKQILNGGNVKNEEKVQQNGSEESEQSNGENDHPMETISNSTEEKTADECHAEEDTNTSTENNEKNNLDEIISANSNKDKVEDKNEDTVIDDNKTTKIDENKDTVIDENIDTITDENNDTVIIENKDTIIDENKDTIINENKDKLVDINDDNIVEKNVDINNVELKVKEKQIVEVIIDTEENLNENKINEEKMEVDESIYTKENTKVDPIIKPTLSNEKQDDLIEIEDPDDYLLHLEDILRQIHKTFYEEYDKLESGDVPDLKKVIPNVRGEILKGSRLVFSGLVPTHIKLEQSKAYLVAKSLGAIVTQDLDDETTHLVAVRPGTAKVNAGRRRKNLKIVTPDWLWSCAERWEHVEEAIYPLNSKGSKNRHPPPHCSSPDHVPNYPTHDTPGIRKRTPSGRFMDTINPLMSFSSDDIADMDKEVEDILDDESDESENENTKTEIVENIPPVIITRKEEDSSSSSEDSLTSEFPRGFKRTREKRAQEMADEDLMESSLDEFPSTKFRRGEQLDSDLDIGQESNSEGSVEPPDEVDDGEWNMMGAALEREFLSNN